MVFRDNRNDERYREIKQELTEIENKGGSVTMCNVAQAIEERGIEKGKLIQLIELVNNGDLSIERASEKAGMTIEEFREQMQRLFRIK